MPVHLWQGELDISVPPSRSRYIASQLKTCHAGHFWIFEHMLDVLVPMGERKP